MQRQLLPMMELVHGLIDWPLAVVHQQQTMINDTVGIELSLLGTPGMPSSRMGTELWR